MRILSRLAGGVAFAAVLLAGSFPHGDVRAGHAATLSAPVRGGTVIDGLYEEPTSLLPNTGFIAFSIMVQETLFSPLFYSDAAGALHPGLAAEIPTVGNGGISRDGLTYVFHLRPGLKWSDGQPLDARDVDYSWRLWTNKDAVVNSTTGFDHIKSAQVSADNLSITFHLTSPYAPFVGVWTDQVMPVPQHVLGAQSAKQINTSKFVFAPTVSSGPFEISSRKSGQNIVETRNPHFYMPGKPYLDRLIFRIIPDETALTDALAAHEIDAAWFLDISQFSTLNHISGYTFITPAAPNFEQGLLNLKNPILQDVRVRQALEYGLDRQTMVASVWHNRAALGASDETAAAFSYDPAVKPYPFNPTKAAQLLDEAGWKLGSDGRRRKNGKTLTLRWSTTARSTFRAQDELIALTDYQNLGIDLRIVNYDGSSYFGSVLPGGNFDIGEWENGLVYDPDTTAASFFAGNAFPPKGSNWGSYNNPAYNRLIAAEEATTNVAARKVIFAKMQAIMNRDLPALWLYNPPTPAEYSDKLHNYAPAPFAYETWNTWEWWKS